MGAILEAVLVSDIDGFCVEIPISCPLKPVRAIVKPCNGGNNQALSINNRSGIISDKNNKHLTSRDNSDKDQAEIVSGEIKYTKGNLWKSKDGSLINRFGFCLERVKPKDNEWSDLIQAKCDTENSWQKFHFA